MKVKAGKAEDESRNKGQKNMLDDGELEEAEPTRSREVAVSCMRILTTGGIWLPHGFTKGHQMVTHKNRWATIICKRHGRVTAGCESL